jgi:translation initiation factor 2 subunit 2
MSNTEEQAVGSEEEQQLKEMFDLTRRKRRIRKKEIKQPKPGDTLFYDTKKSQEQYDYALLLKRFYEQMPPESHKQISIKAPQVERVGTNKTKWVNFDEFAKTINRSHTHILKFISTELNAICSINGQTQLIIRGRFSSMHVEGLLKKYISRYLKCSTCRSMNTTLNRDQYSRLTYIQCNECHSVRTV